MNKKKGRLYFVRALLVFVVFVYLLSVVVGIFGNPNFALALFAYNSFLSVILYFLFGMQRRLDKIAEEAQAQADENTSNESSNESSNERKN